MVVTLPGNHHQNTNKEKDPVQSWLQHYHFTLLLRYFLMTILRKHCQISKEVYIDGAQ